MVEGRERFQWSHTSSLLSIVSSLFGKGHTPTKFNPWLVADQEQHKPTPQESESIFGAMFSALDRGMVR